MMIRSSVTISLVPEAKGGPFVFHGKLDDGLEKAAALGFDAIELFLPGAEAISPGRLRRSLRDCNLRLSALGTGGGYLRQGWTLCSPDESVRQRAREFIFEMMYLGAEFEAPVIIGSMKGSVAQKEDRETVVTRLTAQLRRLAEKAAELEVGILLEPLNRYETNLVNTIQEGLLLLKRVGSDRFRLLGDLFHMNIEETSIWNALGQAGRHLGYLHFVDSNRRAPGFGHLDFAKLAMVLKEIDYEGFLSAEVLALPDSLSAAGKTVESFQRYIRPLNQEKSL